MYTKCLIKKGVVNFHVTTVWFLALVRFCWKSSLLFWFFKLHVYHDLLSSSIKSIIYKLLWIVGQLTGAISNCLIENLFFTLNIIYLSKLCPCFFISMHFVKLTQQFLRGEEQYNVKILRPTKYWKHNLLLKSQDNSFQVRVCKSWVESNDSNFPYNHLNEKLEYYNLLRYL